ncbi:MAG: hypothetical protein HQL16_05125 [Candidatus Omnitrophica bacterium]|nr:hypothetical protein [Candidatus Omnitrophota bacterium]
MRNWLFTKWVSFVTLLTFIVSGAAPAYAQGLSLGTGAGVLPEPGTMVSLSQPFNPPILKGIKVYANNPLKFDFILDKGGEASSLKTESEKLIRYFLASLTVPEKDLWVNLSPYEKDRIIPDAFGQTEMGRDLLAEDYILKQITASALYPQDALGQSFWKKVYARAYEKYGTTDIPVDTFNKVWIVPAKAVVFERQLEQPREADASFSQLDRKNESVLAERGQKAVAYVVESKLKVMLESDYLAQEKNVNRAPTQEIAKDILREVVIPALETEVNTGKNFSQLRQVYNSIILAAWYKRKIKESLLSSVYVDQKKVQGINIEDSEITQKIWQQYVDAFKKGAFNFIKEEQDELSSEMIPRKYFSGGADFAQTLPAVISFTDNFSSLPELSSDQAMMTVSVNLVSSLKLESEEGIESAREVVSANDNFDVLAGQVAGIPFNETNREKLENILMDIEMRGQPVFTDEAAAKMVDKARSKLYPKLVFLKELLEFQDDKGRPLFSFPDAIRIARDKVADMKDDLMFDIYTLLKVGIEEGAQFFNGNQILYIIFGADEFGAQLQLIDELRQDKNFTSDDITRIIRASGSSDKKRSLVARWKKLMADSGVTPLLGGADIAKFIDKHLDLPEKESDLKKAVTKIQEKIKEAAALSAAQEPLGTLDLDIKRVATADMAKFAQRLNDLDGDEVISQLSRLKLAEKAVFTDEQAAALAQTRVHLGKGIAERVLFLHYAVQESLRAGRDIENISELVDLSISYSLKREEQVREEISWLLNFKAPQEEGLFFEMYDIAFIIRTAVPTEEKKTQAAYLLSVPARDGVGRFFTHVQVALMLANQESLVDKKKLVSYAFSLSAYNGQPLFNNNEVTKIVRSPIPGAEKMSLIADLHDKKASFGGEDVPFLSGAVIAELLLHRFDRVPPQAQESLIDEHRQEFLNTKAPMGTLKARAVRAAVAAFGRVDIMNEDKFLQFQSGLKGLSKVEVAVQLRRLRFNSRYLFTEEQAVAMSTRNAAGRAGFLRELLKWHGELKRPVTNEVLSTIMRVANYYSPLRGSDFIEEMHWFLEQGFTVAQLVYIINKTTSFAEKKKLYEFLREFKKPDGKGDFFSRTEMAIILDAGTPKEGKIYWVGRLKEEKTAGANARPLLSGEEISVLMTRRFDLKTPEEQREIIDNFVKADTLARGSPDDIAARGLELTPVDMMDAQSFNKFLEAMDAIKNYSSATAAQLRRLKFQGQDAFSESEIKAMTERGEKRNKVMRGLTQRVRAFQYIVQEYLGSGREISDIVQLADFAREYPLAEDTDIDVRQETRELFTFKISGQEALFFSLPQIRSLIRKLVPLDEMQGQIRYLLSFPAQGRKGYFFSPADISDLIDKKDIFISQKDMLEYLVQQRDDEGRSVFTGHQVKTILKGDMPRDTKTKMLGELLSLKTKDNNHLLAGVDIALFILKYRHISLELFQGIWRNFEDTNVTAGQVIDDIVAPEETRQLLNTWLTGETRNFTEPVWRARHALVFGRGNNGSVTSVTTQSIKFLAGALFPDEKAYFEKAIDEAVRKDQQLIKGLSPDMPPDDVVIKQLHSSLDPDVRKQLSSLLLSWLKDTLSAAHERLSKDSRTDLSKSWDALDKYIEKYEWSRDNGGLENLKRNIYIMISNLRYTTWLSELSPRSRQIISATYYLKKDPSRTNEEVNRILRKKFSIQEIETAREGSPVSLDKTFSDEEHNLYDVLGQESHNDMGWVEDDGNEAVSESRAPTQVTIILMGKTYTVPAETISEAFIKLAQTGDADAKENLRRVFEPDGLFTAHLNGGEPFDLTDFNVLETPLSEDNNTLVIRGPDDAMAADKGGIDFNSSRMTLETQGSAGAMAFNIDPAIMEELRSAPGFVPVVIGIQPLNSLSEFLSVNPAAR